MFSSDTAAGSEGSTGKQVGPENKLDYMLYLLWKTRSFIINSQFFIIWIIRQRNCDCYKYTFAHVGYIFNFCLSGSFSLYNKVHNNNYSCCVSSLAGQLCLHFSPWECVALTQSWSREVLKATSQRGQQLLQQGGWGWTLYTAGHVASGLIPGAAWPGSETEL